MPLVATDTIVAIATPPGVGGIGVIRVSGPIVPKIATNILGHLPAPRHAELCTFQDADGRPIDQGIALYFRQPSSFTGEDVLELQGHGGPLVLDMLLHRITALGARIAHPGEFSKRAFLNDKIDLTQAEAVADLIQSSTAQAARSALRSLQGEFSRRIHFLVEQLVDLRAYVEAALDFPDEEIDFLADDTVARRLGRLRTAMETITESATQGTLLREGIRLVILGPPNAGKSSLLNRLTGIESAIVTEIPGTTRDLIRDRVEIDGIPVHLVDTAGLRESADPIEREGVRRAHSESTKADQILLVVDDNATPDIDEATLLVSLTDVDNQRTPITIVHNKIDLSGALAGVRRMENRCRIYLSAETGAGLDQLRAHIKENAGFATPSHDGLFIARRRHLDSLQQASTAIERGAEQLQDYRAGELLAEELRSAQQALAEITGQFTSDDLLDRIFSTFCIGK